MRRASNIFAIATLLAIFGQLTPCLAADRALLIGVTEYQDPSIIRLPGVANDIKAMQQLVTETLDYPATSVQVVTGAAATREGILAAINQWLIAGTGKDDRALLYYSGHGSYVPDLSGDEADGLDETLAPANTRRGTKGLEKQILDDELEALMAKLSDRRVTAIFDSCNSGTVTRSLGDGPIPRSILNSGIKRPSDASAPMVATRRGLAVWTAATASQAAVDDAGGSPPMGVFTRGFTRALRSRSADANHDGQISHQELLNALTREAQSFCKGKCLPPLPTLEVELGMLAQPVEVSLKKKTALKLSTQLLASSLLPAGSSPVLTLAAALEPSPKVGKASKSSGELELEIRRDCRDGSCDDREPLARNSAGLVVVKAGQALTYRIKSPIAGQLIFLDLLPDGSIAPIFPSPSFPLSSGSAIQAGKYRQLPGLADPIQISATPPWGNGFLLAVVADRSVDFSPLFTRSRNILVERADGADAAIERIARLLRRPVGDGKNQLRTADYRIAQLGYVAGP